MVNSTSPLLTLLPSDTSSSVTVPDTPGSTAEEFALARVPFPATVTDRIPRVTCEVTYRVAVAFLPMAPYTRNPATTTTTATTAISPHGAERFRRARGSATENHRPLARRPAEPVS